jgi:hypothetical protein
MHPHIIQALNDDGDKDNQAAHEPGSECVASDSIA